MRRPQSASGLAAVMASLFVVSLTAAPVDAARAKGKVSPKTASGAPACTAWTSEFTPPPTIRVLRTQRDAVAGEVVGTVQEVPFRDYVATTMAVEWPDKYPLETIKAGAVATKQFAWYHVIHPRGGQAPQPDGSMACYDVVDNTVDQYYYPEKYGVGMPAGPGSKVMAALDETWDVTVRKFRQASQSSELFMTGYRAGETSTCGADANGFKLYHNSARACGEDGLTYREILRRYLMPYLEIVSVGRHDVFGSDQGDAAAIVEGSDGLRVAHVWTVGEEPTDPGLGQGSKAGVRIASEELVGFHSADVNDDGWDDLVWLLQTDTRSGRIKVALSDGSGYGADQIWFDGDLLAPLGGAVLLSGDFHADGRTDVAFLARGETEGTSQLVVLKQKPGDGFTPPVRWWSGTQDLGAIAAAWAGDVSGDGRSDLIVREDPATGGVRIKTALTKSPLPPGSDRMNPLRVAFESAALEAAKVKTIPGDANRDGREDVLMLIGGRGRARVHRLQGQAFGGFKRVPIWTALKSDPIAVEKTRLGAADVDYDGLTDLVLFSRHSSGTRIRVLKTRYSTLKRGVELVEPYEWSSVRPY